MQNNNIKPENHYDLIIIGAGPGGYVAAEHAAKNGLKTIIFEKEHFGGVCLNKGCIPTKSLLKSAKIFHYIKEAEQFGIIFNKECSFKIDWNKMQNRKKEVVAKLVEGIKFLLKNAKATYVEGYATLIGDHTVEANKELYYGEKIILATGSYPRDLNLPGFKEAKANKIVIDSTDSLMLDEVPKEFGVIGGGVIGVEFAILYAELGSKVTIFQGLDTILELLDKDISKSITEYLIKKGVKILTNVKVKSIKKDRLIYEIDNKEEEYKVDKLLVSVGRVADYSAFKNIDINYDEKNKIVLNQHLQTSKRHIYAIGDVSQQIMLAHVAYKHAIMAVDHIRGWDVKYNLFETPSCIYTYPEVATIGYTEEQLSGVNYISSKIPMSHIGKALADNESFGFVKMLFEKESGKILGCHIIAATASDLISEISLAMQVEATVFDLATTIHPHPTLSEIFYDVAKKAIYENYSK
ncbi:MAG: dihydrolipoyl dehydrogenase [Mycoplasmoidaceae bacterium]